MASEWVVLYLVVRETVSPSLRQKLQLGFEAALVLPYTHRFTKKCCHTSHWLCHEYQWLLLFWTHSTKQTVKNVQAWLCSTWPTPYIQFNGIMNTQYKGIVHDTKLLCTMHDLCHRFSSFKGLYFSVAVSSGVSVTFQQVTLTVVWIILVIKTEMTLTHGLKTAFVLCEILGVNIFCISLEIILLTHFPCIHPSIPLIPIVVGLVWEKSWLTVTGKIQFVSKNNKKIIWVKFVSRCTRSLWDFF